MSEHRSHKRTIAKFGTAIVAVLLAANLGLSAKASAADSPAPNPVLNTATCGASLKIALVVDLSASMDGEGITSLQSASSSLVDTLTGTDAQIALYTFSGTSPANTTNDANHPLTPLATEDEANQVKEWINGWSTEFMTSWASGLTQVANDENSGADYDMVLFITDGNPYDSTQSIEPANAIKAKGTRIIGFIVGSEVTDEYIPYITGTVTNDPVLANNDYFSGSWSNFGQLLGQMATLCPVQVSIPVQYVDDDSNEAVVQAPGTTTLTGLDGTSVGYTVTQAQAGVPTGYDYVSLDNVATFDSKTNQTITVHLKHQQAAPPAVTVPNTPQTVSAYTGGTAVHVSPATALAAGAGAVALLAGLVAIGYLRRVRN